MLFPGFRSNLNRSERSEKLPQNVLLRLRRQVVNKDAPAAAVHRRLGRIGSTGRQEGVGCQEITGEGRVSGVQKNPENELIEIEREIVYRHTHLQGCQIFLDPNITKTEKYTK
jgi:hypothetical protein